MTWLFSTLPGRLVLMLVLLAMLALWVPSARPALGWVWRLLTGGLVLRRPGVWDSKWLYPAPDRPDNRPAFRGESFPRTRWAMMPGYRRMVIRAAVVAYLLTLQAFVVPVMSATGAVVVALAVRQALRLLHNWGLSESAGLFAAGAAGLLGYGTRDPATWIAVPRIRVVRQPIPVSDRVLRLVRRLLGERVEHILGALWVPVLRVPLDDDDARVRVALDAEITNTNLVRDVGELAVKRLPDGPWEATHREKELAIELRHPKRPPAQVWYTAEANHKYQVDDVPIGQLAGGVWATLPLKKLTPHVIISASTGWGKTTVARVYVAHTAGNGGFVLLNDPKRVGYLQEFANLPNVVIRGTVEGWVDNIERFYAEMQRRYQIIEAHPEIADDPELYFRPWFMVTDERGSYVSEIKAWWKREGAPDAQAAKGLPEPLRLEKLILWQARAAAMYVLDMAQQANLPVFIDSDGRDQHMARIAAGPQTRSSWMMLFPGLAKMRTLMKKGRAMLGIGPDEVHEIQLAQVSVKDSREFAAAGAAIAERAGAEREKRLAALLGASVPAAGPAPHPGETGPSVPGQRTDGQTRGIDDENETRHLLSVINGEGGESAGESVRPDLSVIENGADNGPDNDLIVGLQAAADHLGMTLANFEKARQRRPIEGEERQGKQPSWRTLNLQEWRAQAPRAGRQAAGDE